LCVKFNLLQTVAVNNNQTRLLWEPALAPIQQILNRLRLGDQATATHAS
jgi:hypothetical protein